MHTIVFADGALEAKSARNPRHRLFLKGAWSEQIANRTSNRAAITSKSDNNCSYQGNLGVKKVDFLMQNAWNCFTKTCFPLQREAFFENMWFLKSWKPTLICCVVGRGMYIVPIPNGKCTKIGRGSFSTYHLGSIVHHGAVIAYFYGFILPVYELLPTWLFCIIRLARGKHQVLKVFEMAYRPSFNCLMNVPICLIFPSTLAFL